MHIYIALPAMNELDHLEITLNSLKEQTTQNFSVYICINQPENYRDISDKREIFDNNQQLLKSLQNYTGLNLYIIDRSSPGLGWVGKLHGVGQARKVILDEIAATAADEDLIVSLDADTLLYPNYLSEIILAFKNNRKALALSAPYYHPLSGDEVLDRAVLRYEIYMRHYLLNLFRINCPYAFSALGSALAVTVQAYKKIGGMTPKLSGEDFYFLQKIKKCGQLLIDLPCPVLPAARYSDRVFFGTGPALIKGAAGDWESYPIYAAELFDQIGQTYQSFAELYTNTSKTTPLDDFMRSIFKEEQPWQPLRKNNKTAENFSKACHEKLDGLRILQYVKEQNQLSIQTDEEKLCAFIAQFYPEAEINKALPFASFLTIDITTLNNIRDFLYAQEMDQRKKINCLT